MGEERSLQPQNNNHQSPELVCLFWCISWQRVLCILLYANQFECSARTYWSVHEHPPSRPERTCRYRWQKSRKRKTDLSNDPGDVWAECIAVESPGRFPCRDVSVPRLGLLVRRIFLPSQIPSTARAFRFKPSNKSCPVRYSTIFWSETATKLW